MLDEMLGFFPHMNSHLSGDPVWDSLYRRCQKYRPFLRSKGLFSNPFKYRKMLKEKLEDLGVGA
jgi:hypothetical protein